MTQTDPHSVGDSVTVTVGEVAPLASVLGRDGEPARVDESGYDDADVKGPGPEWPARPDPLLTAGLPQAEPDGETVKGPDPAQWG